MSFEERVINKTNLLINKYNGNYNKFQNHTMYNEWLSEGKITNNLLVKEVGETYNIRYLIRNTKAALKKKNRMEIRRLNQFLKDKNHCNITIDKLANFIGFLVSKDTNIKKTFVSPIVNNNITNNFKDNKNVLICNKENIDNEIDESNKTIIFFRKENEELDNWEDWDN